jgi:hypothetical protein
MEGYKTVNIEEGMPFVDEAIKRLTYEIETAKRQKYVALKIIHGYGSSGTGGRLRIEIRKYLNSQKKKGAILDFITGEEFSIFNMAAIRVMDRCESLRKDRDLNRSNNGITLIQL